MGDSTLQVYEDYRSSIRVFRIRMARRAGFKSAYECPECPRTRNSQCDSP